MHTEPKTDPQRTAPKRGKIHSQPPTGLVNCTTPPPLHRRTNGTLRDSAQVDTEAFVRRNKHHGGEHRETGQAHSGSHYPAMGKAGGHISAHTLIHTQTQSHMQCIWRNPTLAIHLPAPSTHSAFGPRLPPAPRPLSEQAGVPARSMLRGATKLKGTRMGGGAPYSCGHSFGNAPAAVGPQLQQGRRRRSLQLSPAMQVQLPASRL